MLNDELKQHYLDTTYIVYFDDQQHDIKIDHANPHAIQQHFNTTQETSACIVTAWNPRSQPLSTTENKQRNRTLFDSLKEKNYLVYNALGQGKDTTWPAEESYFIFGVSKQEADLFSTEYEQYAYVWVESNKTASLIFTSIWQD